MHFGFRGGDDRWTDEGRLSCRGREVEPHDLPGEPLKVEVEWAGSEFADPSLCPIGPGDPNVYGG